MTIAEHLKIFVERFETSKEAAKQLGISTQLLSNYMTGHSNPGSKVLLRLQQAGYIIGESNVSTPDVYEEAYKQGVKDTEEKYKIEIAVLKGQVDTLKDVLTRLIDVTPHIEQHDNTGKEQQREFTDISTVESDVEINTPPVTKRKVHNVTPLKAAATPITGRTNDNDQP